MSDPARQLREHGYAVLPDVLNAGDTAALRAGLEAHLASIAPPSYYAAETEVVSDTVSITSSGLALPRLLDDCPGLRPLILRPALVDPVYQLFGDGMRLELVGASVSDEQREFFSWHTHIDGEDESARARANQWPVIDDLQRVSTLLYLNDLNAESGPLFVLPRRVGEPTPPPYDMYTEQWPGMVELRPRAGSVVVLEQCTWHAAGSLQGPGLRMFIGCYWAAASASSPNWVDDKLASAWQQL